uniref:Uncharacterized protein n=1 Tax=Arundo donax TaxID=35708 RepID=A0A0A9BXL8_ARUDO
MRILKLLSLFARY